ncbi:MAG: ATP-binding protein [Oryzomonas sp.]|jgi:signal transduction histidine kinase
MEARTHPNQAAKQLIELTILYQFSNTMLSTIRLNKLTHLILTALTSGSTRLFERAMLFLRNERTGMLLGMLGVTQDTAGGLKVVGGEDALSCRWDIDDDVIAHQRESAFSKHIRSTRIEASVDCAIIRRVIHEQRLYTPGEDGCQACEACDFSHRLGVNAFAVVPLVARNRVLGIIVVDNSPFKKAINHDDLHFLQLIANQAGMAVENSMLYNRLEEAHTSLRDARERLVHGERLAAIGEMAANLAHELKNPIVTIGGFAGRLVKGLSSDSREYQYADTIVKEIVRLERMLADILAFSRKPTICYNICDVGEILNDCFATCATNLEDQGVTLARSFEGGPWTTLGDAHQLKQVFLNLVLNACEAMPDGGSLHVSLRKVSLDKKCILVSIRDSGGGIPADMLPKIFNPFYTTKPHGTGLGLAIVNRILQNHGGSIEARNEGNGAMFTVTLQQAEAH